MRRISLFLIIAFGLAPLYAQGDLQKLVDTEHAFAKYASEHDTKSAFLEFMASDAVLFQPDKVNGPEFWKTRGESKGLLSWAPNYADISANGLLGYTTGKWEYRVKGKDDPPTAFGDFVTIWLRQPDASYKVVLDIGVSHAKPEKYSSEWATAKDVLTDQNTANLSAGVPMHGFYETATQVTPKKAYEKYAADDIRLYREDRAPFVGKNSSAKEAASEKGVLTLAKRSTVFESADLAYTTSTYSRTIDGKVVEKGNYMQIWKLKAGKWLIVLDIFATVPQK